MVSRTTMALDGVVVVGRGQGGRSDQRNKCNSPRSVYLNCNCHTSLIGIIKP